MSSEVLTVYLDHLIPRENLRYKRSKESISDTVSKTLTLRMSDLFGDHISSRVKSLRKPDFQRATWAWTPEDCVSLLESIINEQVIPSVIMWSSPENGYDYVLDGDHRISVVLAWLNDDWGDHLSSEHYKDEEQERLIKQAARKVRDLVKLKIGDISDYQAADTEFYRLVEEGKAPKQDLDARTYNRGRFYQRLRKGDVGFNIQWVPGDYEKAELSFLKINKSGKHLSDWEISLIENRHSSLSRVVMSIANLNSVTHYWHDKEVNEANKDAISAKINSIIDGIGQLHEILLQPTYETPIRRLQQPLLVPPDIEKKPYYLAELFTTIKGGKGQKAETQELMKRDKNAPVEEIINNGWQLVQDGLDALSHLVGPSPKSLAIVPALYLYTEAGRYVRSLLYGLFYWLLAGSEEDILNRKRVLSIHRAVFEQVLLDNKEDIVGGITRKTGSGPEVTSQTAQYYQGLLELLVSHKDNTLSNAFATEYSALTKRLTNKASKVRVTPAQGGKSRIFTPSQKSAVVLANFFSNPNRCGICGGILDPGSDLQHDHIERYNDSNTLRGNQRIVHPFCNNQTNREIIEAGRQGKDVVKLPRFMDPDFADEPSQLRLGFFDDPSFAD